MLYVLKDASHKSRKHILRHVDCEVIKTIAEIAYNTLVGNNKINTKTRNSLRKYKRELRTLACLQTSLASKRKIIVQKGGFLPTLLGTVLSGVLATVIDKYGK